MTSDSRCFRYLSAISTFRVKAEELKKSSPAAPRRSEEFCINDRAWYGTEERYAYRLAVHLSAASRYVVVKCELSRALQATASFSARASGATAVARAIKRRQLQHITFDLARWYYVPKINKMRAGAAILFTMNLKITVDPFLKLLRPLPSFPANTEDFTVSCGGRLYPCHRSALTAASAFFRETLEQFQDPELELIGDDPDSVGQLLSSVYNDHFDRRFSTRIFIYGDKYDCPLVQLRAMQYLVEDLTIDSALSTLACVYYYGCPESGVYDYVERFVIKNLWTLQTLDEERWAFFRRAVPALAHRIVVLKSMPKNW